jgi:hypothetical protein
MALASCSTGVKSLAQAHTSGPSPINSLRTSGTGLHFLSLNIQPILNSVRGVMITSGKSVVSYAIISARGSGHNLNANIALLETSA